MTNDGKSDPFVIRRLSYTGLMPKNRMGDVGFF